MTKIIQQLHVKIVSKSLVFALLLMGCSSLESSVFPEEFKGIRFGMTEQKLKKKRPEAGKESCPKGVKLKLCLKEKEGIAGFSSVTWGFIDGRLVYVEFDVENPDDKVKLLDEQISEIRGITGFQAPVVALQQAPAKLSSEVYWEKEGVAILAKSTVVDITSVAAALGSAVGLGPSLFFQYSVFDSSKVKLQKPKEPVPLADATEAMHAFYALSDGRAKLVEAFRSEPLDKQHCEFLEVLADVEIPFCEALLEPVETGRTTREGRAILTERLRKRGYYPFTAFMVARIRKGLYEVARLEHSYWYGYAPTGDRLLLKTVATEYSSKGRFTLWVKDLGKERIETKDGFYQTWDVVEEDDLGTAIKRVFDAPAGDQTSQAARDLLIELASGGMEG